MDIDAGRTDAFRHILVDRPSDRIFRITLNRPEKRNALSNALRGELFEALVLADRDASIHVTILRGGEKAFSAGYDLSADANKDQPFFTSAGIGNWPRHVVDGGFFIWDLAKPVIAQVAGYCLAGGMELAQSCDLVFAAEDAKIGYPPVRSISPPDNQFFPWVMGLRKAMYLMLTGDAISGRQAVEYGFANACFPAPDLDEAVLAVAKRIANVPTDLLQFNKRSVHRQMDLMGLRAAIRAGTEMQALACYSETTQRFFQSIQQAGLTGALSERDAKFGDYRTAPKEGG